MLSAYWSAWFVPAALSEVGSVRKLTAVADHELKKGKESRGIIIHHHSALMHRVSRLIAVFTAIYLIKNMCTSLHKDWLFQVSRNSRIKKIQAISRTKLK